MNNNTLSSRHETLFLWEVRKSNPNGDPNGNEPRIDRYTNKCDVTDVSIKRSVRDYINQTKDNPAILVTRLGEDHSQIVTLTERIADFLFGSAQSKEATLKIVEESMKLPINNIKEQIRELDEMISKEQRDEMKKTLLNNKKTVEDRLKAFEEFKVNSTADKLRVLIDDIDSWPNLIADLRRHMCQCFYDLRMFGSVLAIKSKTPLANLGGPLTGPIQIEVGTSLHRVVQSNKQITSIMAPDKKPAEEGEGFDHGGGSFGDSHCIEYGLFATSAVANENAAKFTGLSDEDHDLFLKALWRGTRDRHTRSKNQVPRLLIDIEYTKPFHFGDLVNCVQLAPKEKDGKPLDEEAYRSLDDFTLDLSKLCEKIKERKEIIKSIRVASNGLSLIKDKFSCDDKSTSKVCEIPDIDYDSSKDLANVDINDDAKEVLKNMKGVVYCEAKKVLTITPDLSEEDLKHLLENPALETYRELIKKAFSELKGA